MEVGVRHKGYWCVRDFDNPLWWRSQELYLLLVILLIPILVMSYCYGRIISAVRQMDRQRRHLTQHCGKTSIVSGYVT